jgi:DNA-binding NarL/FixJ family response regulator
MDTTRKLLQSYLNRESKSRDVYHDLMPFKVKEILLISSLYDAYSIEREGRFSEVMLHEYGTMNLTSLPRITGVSSEDEAFENLGSNTYELVIFMVGMDKKAPLRLSKKIKARYPDTAIFMLLNNNQDVKDYLEYENKNHFDRIFTWNGESRIFFAMIKYLEDMKNVEVDTSLAGIRLILLIEDSPIYYSRYLTHLYKIIFAQTSKLVNEFSSDDLFKVLKLRVRPKLLLATNYEDAFNYFKQFNENIFCLITDVRFPRNGMLDEKAGIRLLEKIRETKKLLPVIIQSSDRSNSQVAEELNTDFLDKNHQNLYKELKFKVNQTIGFGNFIFKNFREEVLAVAKNINEFENIIKTIDEDSIMFHALRNDFSRWLMARSEFQLAKVLVVKQANEFKDAEEIRNYLLKTIYEYKHEKPFGKLIPFDEAACLNSDNVIRLAEGALGGKGRGITFVNSLKRQFDFEHKFKGLKIKTPKTAVIGTDAFNDFIERNNLEFDELENYNYREIKKRFLSGHLNNELLDRLYYILDRCHKPLAIRSSGLLEDSLSQAFAGIFDTFVIPNNHPDKNMRFRQLTDAIKLVYASVFSQKSMNYINAVNYKIGEEEMGIVIQELVGNDFGGMYYPHISGVAQSYNFYPFGHMKPSEGFAVAALGLGTYVVDGENAYRFSPLYPTTQLLSLDDQVKNTQVYFYAVDLTKKDLNLLEGSKASLKTLNLHVAEKHGSLKHLVSVFDINNQALYPGLGRPGPRVVNFASILKNEHIPMAKAIRFVLDLVKEAFGSPVEIEFAVDLNRDPEGDAAFYILQVKPLIQSVETYEINQEELQQDKILIYAEKGMGNGYINTISDIIYIDNEKFDKSKTREMAVEIEKINRKMVKENRNYILIGPGRWGTRDRWIGIPVNWAQISNAKVIIETSLTGFPLDASFGSHFFHNLTTLNVAYFSIRHDHKTSFIDYSQLNGSKQLKKKGFFRHVRFKKPLQIKMDGKKQIAVIEYD